MQPAYRRRGFAVLLLLAAALIGHGAALAQTAPKKHAATAATVEVPDHPLSQDEINALVARLDDAQVRQVLIEQLQRMSASDAANRKPTSADATAAVSDLEFAAADIRQRAIETVEAIGTLPALPGWLLNQLASRQGPNHSPLQSLLTLLSFALGIGAELLFARALAGVRSRLDAAQAAARMHMGLWLTRAALDVLRIAVFALTATAALFAIFQGEIVTRRAALVVIASVAAVRLAVRLIYLVLAPEAGAIRLARLDDAAAAAIFYWLRRIGLVVLIGASAIAFLSTLGLDDPTVRLLSVLLCFAVVGLMLVAILQARLPVATRLKAAAGEQHKVLRVLADFWHIPAILYLLLVAGLWLLNLLSGGSKRFGAGVATLLIVLLYPVLIRGLRALAVRYFGLPGTPGAHRVPPSLILALHITLIVGSALLLANVWGLPLDEIMATPFGQTVARAGLHIAVALVLAFAVWEYFEYACRHHLSPREVDGATVEASARVRTLLPMFRIFVAIGLITVATMIVLSAIGVDIGPMLAGAGVVGLAIGFGTQTLVRDVVSGILFMLEDAFRVGDYVEVDRIRGTVEVISLRSLRLRHHRGAVHTLPYGQIRSLTNYTRDWVIDKIELTVPHGTDVDKVRKLLKQIGQELTADPEIGPKMIEPLKSQGIAKITDAGLVIRIKFMSQPREQFVVRRKALSRILEVFTANGIDLSQPRQLQVQVQRHDGEMDEVETEGTSKPDEAAAVAMAVAPAATGTSGGD
jgi:moderate conductance mechanosensitive channel